jgi:4-amino-4-deoxy-L-arabinose transferase-like glycosyltransferase
MWLVDPDEARYAEIPREMLASGDFVTPTLNGAHYFEKPPLLYWLNAASIGAFGNTPSAARLPVRVAALGTAALLLVGLRGMAPDAGLWAALAFLSAPLSFAMARYNIIDGLLTFTLTLAFFSLRALLLAPEGAPRARRHEIGLGAGVALALLSKGLVGVLFPVLVGVLWVALLGRWKRLAAILRSWVPWVFLLVATPWFVLVERANPGFSRFFFVHEHVMRYATPISSRPGPIWYFLAAFVAGFLPWTVAMGSALRPVLSRRRDLWREHADVLFFALWFGVVLVFFSLSRSKLLPYILPAFPAAAALVARPLATGSVQLRNPCLVLAIGLSLAVPVAIGYGIVPRGGAVLSSHGLVGVAIAGAGALLLGSWAAVLLARRSGSRALLASAAGWAGLELALVVALPRLTPEFSAHDLAVEAARAGDAQVVAYHCYPQSFPWVLGRTIAVAEYRDELGSDGVLPPDLYWSKQQFLERWSSNTRLAVVTGWPEYQALASLAPPQPRILARSRHLVLVANFASPAAETRPLE